MTAWFYQINGTIYGPVNSPTLKQMAIAGLLQPTTMVSQNQPLNWVPASKIKGLVFQGQNYLHKLTQQALRVLTFPAATAPLRFTPPPALPPAPYLDPAPVNWSMPANGAEMGQYDYQTLPGQPPATNKSMAQPNRLVVYAGVLGFLVICIICAGGYLLVASRTKSAQNSSANKDSKTVVNAQSKPSISKSFVIKHGTEIARQRLASLGLIILSNI